MTKITHAEIAALFGDLVPVHVFTEIIRITETAGTVEDARLQLKVLSDIQLTKREAEGGLDIVEQCARICEKRAEAIVKTTPDPEQPGTEKQHQAWISGAYNSLYLAANDMRRQLSTNI